MIITIVTDLYEMRIGEVTLKRADYNVWLVVTSRGRGEIISEVLNMSRQEFG